MTSTSVKVAVRIRPLNAKELFSSSIECVKLVPNQPQIVISLDVGGGMAMGVTNTNRSFTFDDVFGSDSIQSQVYHTCVEPLVQRFLDGYNSTTLAYGQTGSGKTYSMGTGLGNDALPFEHQGIVPRAISDIFDRIESARARNPDGYKYSVAVSFLELYNEDLVDLLNPRPKTAGSSGGPTIREDSHGHIVWVGVREVEVRSPEDLLSCLQRGSLCRTTGSTDMNVSSSRSHAIFSVILRQQKWCVNPKPITEETKDNASAGNEPVDIEDEEVGPEQYPDGYWTSLTSKFHFVDLAGSERLKRTNAEGDRKKEGISINQGLLALGNVISALGDETKRGSHVPYRDSKLTRMLQDSLGGNSQTLMLACISPSDTNYGETISTLTYANRARNIRNRVVLNQEVLGGSNDKEVKALRALVAELKDEIVALRAGRTGTQQGGSEAQDQAVHSVSEVLLAKERERQLLLQEERDLAAKLKQAQKDQQMGQFEVDRLTFRCSRLAERLAMANEELNSVVSERDAALIDLDKWRNGKMTTETGGSPKGPEKSIAITASYNQTISELRFRLAEANDRLAWYDEVMAELEGKRIEKMTKNYSTEFDPSLDVPSKHWSRLSQSGGNVTEMNHERRLLRMLKDDSEAGKVLLATGNTTSTPTDHDETTNNLRLFGLPSQATSSNHPSRLTRSVEAGDNDEDGYVDVDEDDDHAGDDEIPIRPATAATSDRSADMYLLIHRLQADIQDHQALVDRLNKREQEYEALRQVYEGKINMLQAEKSAAAKERDEALKRMTSKQGGKAHEKAGTAAIKAQFEAKAKKLEAEITMNKKKLAEAMRANKKSQNDNLTKQLTSTIESLKVEKANMLKELRKEAEKNRTLQTAKEREIAKLRKKEKAAAEMAKKLERSNQLQRLILKRRSEEVIQSHSKLKSVLSLLKRLPGSAGGKGGLVVRSGAVSPTKQRPIMRKSNSRRGSALKDNSVLENLRLGLHESLTTEEHIQSPPAHIRSKFKKQIIEKELATVVTFRMAENEVNKLKEARDRLVGEQKELMVKLISFMMSLSLYKNERERCVKAEYDQTGVWEPHKPQYMDERLGVLDMEVAMVNSKIRSAEEEIRLGKAALAMSAMSSAADEVLSPASPPSYVPSTSEGDLGWENAVNLLRSLDGPELEMVSTAFLEDLVGLKVHLKSYEAALQDSEKNISDLQVALETMRGAALQTAMEYRKEMEMIQESASKQLAEIKHGDHEKVDLERVPATPRLQRMFDAAYGHGVIGVPSKSNLTDLASETTVDEGTGGLGDDSSLPTKPWDMAKSLNHHHRIVNELDNKLSQNQVLEDHDTLSETSSRDDRWKRLTSTSSRSLSSNKDKRFSRGFLNPASQLSESPQPQQSSTISLKPDISAPNSRKNSMEKEEALVKPKAANLRRGPWPAPSPDLGTVPLPKSASPTRDRHSVSPTRKASASSLQSFSRSDKWDTQPSGMVAASRSNTSSPTHTESILEDQESLSGWEAFGLSSTSSTNPLVAWGESGRPDYIPPQKNRKTSKSSLSAATTDSSNLLSFPSNIDGLATDVFSRLATSHTLASQAKVIHREKGEGGGGGGAVASIPDGVKRASVSLNRSTPDDEGI